MKNKYFLKELLVFSLTSIVLVYCFMTFLNGFLTEKRLNYEEQIGIHAVNLMYRFDTIFDRKASGYRKKSTKFYRKSVCSKKSLSQAER